MFAKSARALVFERTPKTLLTMAIPVTSDILSMLHNPKIRRFFGVVTLCVAAIATLLALGFVGVSFATDNWKHISVNRNKLAQIVKEQNNTKLDDEFAQDYRYFDRVEGIFRVCFPPGTFLFITLFVFSTISIGFRT